MSSAYRCPTHNNAVSKTGRDGPHTKSAVDIAIHDPTEAFHLLVAALAEGYTGIGVNLAPDTPREKRFLHLDVIADTAELPRPALWSY